MRYVEFRYHPDCECGICKGQKLMLECADNTLAGLEGLVDSARQNGQTFPEMLREKVQRIMSLAKELS